MIDWNAIRTDYIKDPTISLRDLALKYHISLGFLGRKASKDKWVEQRQVAQTKAEQKINERMPETIADIKLRHARIGRMLQTAALQGLKGDPASGRKPILPTNFDDVRQGILTGVTIERAAVGLNDKDIKDEIYQKFSQFTFIFNLTDDELQRFIATIDAGRTSPAVGAEQALLQSEAQGKAPEPVDAVTVSG